MAQVRSSALALAVTLLACTLGSPIALASSPATGTPTADTSAGTAGSGSIDTLLAADSASLREDASATTEANVASSPSSTGRPQGRRHRHRNVAGGNPRNVRYDQFVSSRGDPAGLPPSADRDSDRSGSGEQPGQTGPHGVSLLLAGLVVMAAAARRRQPHELRAPMVPPLWPERTQVESADSASVVQSLSSHELAA